jgi:hypothetical protein
MRQPSRRVSWFTKMHGQNSEITVDCEQAAYLDLS